ncbi:Nucleolar GTP-binding protein 2 [Cichlidogyrus casuarinus]|uniref:Nucleolar GTP-binding protein 2 n=1 Tax=Cichlidogyrus casuarinus TaxID=1844966 RepID=A0ABD2PQS5_9PLAT
MYRNFKAKRNEDGKIIKPAPFQSRLPSGTMARVEPNRRWFGNTRVISQDALQNFKEVMKVRNPYEIVLRQTKLPISLLNEKRVKRKSDILASESFAFAFGKKSQRKKPRLQTDSLAELVHFAEAKKNDYDVEKDVNLERDTDGVRDMVTDPHFKAGRSKRIWNELFKVLDSSDVVLYVLDARDPMGTRSAYIENYLKTEKPHKHFIFVLNKVDLVPVWTTKQWKTILSREYPTLVFHANMEKPLGKNAMISLLRQFAQLHSKDRSQISVGIIGYPNVGKSSIINALRSKKVCNVAPLAGETKVWQYVTLMKSIYLIDCPGVVYPRGDTEAELVMKGVVRVEYLKQPEMYIDDVLRRVKKQYMLARYLLPKLDPDEKEDKETWANNSEMLLELVAKQTGRLLKGGEADLSTTARRILNDFQRGKLPYFVKPELTKDDREEFHKLGIMEPITNAGVGDQSLKELDSSSLKDEDPDENDQSDSEDLQSEPEEGAQSEDEVDLDRLGTFDITATHKETLINGLKKHDDSKTCPDPETTKSTGLNAKRRKQLEKAISKLKSQLGKPADVPSGRKRGKLFK